MGWLLLVVGLLLSIEGIVWIASPQLMLRLLLRGRPASFPARQIRYFGAIPLLIGLVALIYVLVSPQGSLF